MFNICTQKLTLYTKHKYSAEDIITISRSYKYMEYVVKNVRVLNNVISGCLFATPHLVNIFIRSFTPTTIGTIPSTANFSGRRYRLVDTLFTDGVFSVYDLFLVVDSGRQLTNSTSVDCENSFRKDFYIYNKA